MLLLGAIVLVSAYLVFRSSYVQTRLTQSLAYVLSNELTTRVEVGGVDVDFPNYLVIERLYVEDLHADTLAYLDRLNLGLKGYSITTKQVRLGRVSIENVHFFLRKYVGEEDLNLQFIIDKFKTEDTTKATVPKFTFDELMLSNAAFKLDDQNRARVNNALDYTNLEVRRIDLLIDGISLEGDTVRGHVKRLAFQEKRGFAVNQLSGKAKVSSDMLDIKDLKINTPCTFLSLDLHFDYTKWSDYKDFIDAVDMHYILRPSVVDIGDLSYFARGLNGVTSTFRVQGQVDGPVSNLKGRNLRIGYGESTLFEGNVDMQGLPDIGETFIHLKLKRLITDARDLGTLPMPPFSAGKSLVIPDNIANLGKMAFSGNFTGFLNDFVAFGDLRTALGNISSDVALKQLDNGMLSYSGHLASDQFDAGQFFNIKQLGKVTMNTQIDGRGVTRQELDAKLTGTVSSIGFYGYNYSAIKLDGRFADNLFEGQVNTRDTNLVLDFKGKINLKDKLPVFLFTADLAHADLPKLGVKGMHPNARVGGRVKADFVGDDIDNFVGTLRLDSAFYMDSTKQRFSIDQADLKVDQAGTERTMRLRSTVADADFKGQFKFRSIPKAVNNLVRKHLPSYASAFEMLAPSDHIDLDFKLVPKDLSLLFHLCAPTLQMADGADFYGSFYSENDEVQITGDVPMISIGKQKFSGLQLRVGNPGKTMRIDLSVATLHLTDSALLRNVTMQSYTANDSMAVALKWDNDSKPAYKARMAFTASFPRNQQIKVRMLPSELVVNNMTWTVDPRNLITIDSSTFAFKDLAFVNGPRRIGLNGLISKDPRQELTIDLSNFEVALLNIVTARYGLDFGGALNGTAHVSALYATPLFRSQILVDSLMLNRQLLGSGHINSTWLAKQEKLAINAQLGHNGRNTIDAQGHFIPGKNKENFDLRIKLDSIPVSAIEHYVVKVMKDMTGTIGADVALKGPTTAPTLEGQVALQNVELLFTYLNVKLKVNDKVEVRPNGFFLNNVAVLDERGHAGKINGSITHTGFKDLKFDANISINNFLALNTTSAINPLYYGKAFATGVVRFSGKPSQMDLNVSAKTERGTKFNLPLNGTRSIDAQDFISFVKFTDGEAEVAANSTIPQVKFSNLAIELNLEVTSDAEVRILFDPKIGDILKGKGDGDLRIEVSRQGEFKMFGDYTIREGEYLFTLQNIINKKFLLRQGGTINWSGSPYDAQVDLQAAYPVRTSLFTLMADSTNESYRKRILVNVLLTMKDRLMSPAINFGIELPNVDDALRTEAMNKIGINNDQEMNRQVFGLLVLNNFIAPENQDIGSSGTGFLSSSGTEMLSNQISNWLSKISNDFDVGVNYRPGNAITSDEVEVALSTQLFNNRLLVDGNVGVANRQSNASNIVGDVNIEYKITRDGRLRIKAFNKTNDQNLLTTNTPFTQGLGVSYRKDFDRIADLFKRKTKPK